MANDSWETPDWLFNYANKRWGPFDLDVCASKENAKCRNYLTEAQDGLTHFWAGTRCWMNPPYSAPLPWVKRAAEQGDDERLVCCLLPADTSTTYLHEIVWRQAKDICFIRPRIKFVGANGSPKFGSLFVVFGGPYRGKLIEFVDLRPFIR